MASARRDTHLIQDPPIARTLFEDTRTSWLWFLARLYVGYSWLSSGLGKLGNPAWTDTGDALKGFWTSAVQVPASGKAPITFDWYRDFLNGLLVGGQYVWFSKLIVAGELLIGIALILGAFTGIAAFFGSFMNWNFMMAGTASINPVLFTLSILLMLAWKNAGWIGLDRFLLPLFGTPWQRGEVFEEARAPEVARGDTGSRVGT